MVKAKAETKIEPVVEAEAETKTKPTAKAPSVLGSSVTENLWTVPLTGWKPENHKLVS